MAVPAIIVTGFKWLIKWLPTKAGKLVLNGLLRLFFRGLKKGKSKLGKWLDDKCFKLGVYLSEQGNKAGERYKIGDFYEQDAEPFLLGRIDRIKEGMKSDNG